MLNKNFKKKKVKFLKFYFLEIFFNILDKIHNQPEIFVNQPEIFVEIKKCKIFKMLFLKKI